MPKTILSFEPGEYALVADRITLFYDRYPSGRIITKLVSRDRDVVFRATVFRAADDRFPSATGWASEREGDGDINLVACVENTETSAIGRALANLGFTASRKRPSREEMEKAQRARERASRSTDSTHAPARVAEAAPPSVVVLDAKQENAPAGDSVADILTLIEEAEGRGVPLRVLDVFRRRISDGTVGPEGLLSMEREIRHWLLRGFPVARTAAGTSPPASVNS